MRLFLDRHRVRRLPGPRAGTTVVEVAPLAYADASFGERSRIEEEFRRLLERLDSPLQVVVHTQPGDAAVRTPERPSAPSFRGLDLKYIAELDRRPDTRQRRIWFVVSDRLADLVQDQLGQLGARVVARGPSRPQLAVSEGRERPRLFLDASGLHRSWALETLPGGEVPIGWILRLIPERARSCLSWHATRLPPDWTVNRLQRRIVGLQGARSGRSGEADPPARNRQALRSAQDLQSRLAANTESAFHVSIYLTVSAADEASLRLAAERVESSAKASMCTLVPCHFKELDARASTLPLGSDRLRRWHLLPTSAVLSLLPFAEGDLRHPGGVVLGRSVPSGRPVLVDFFDESRFSNANVAVFGETGAGKTHLLSTIALGHVGLGNQVVVIDPENEYGAVSRAVGGAVAILAPGSTDSLNPLDGLTASSEIQIQDAVQLCQLICGALNPVEAAQVERALRLTATSSRAPVLPDLLQHLKRGSRPALQLQTWLAGAFGSLFAQTTSVDLDAPMVVFQMRDVRLESMPALHFLLTSALWRRIASKRQRRVLMVDELGLAFGERLTRRFLVAMARRIRKYDGSFVFATQNPGDVLSSEEGRVVAANPAVHFFGAARPLEARRIQRAFGLSDGQRRRLEGARRGEFLVVAPPERVALQVEAPPWQTAAIAGRSLGQG